MLTYIYKYPSIYQVYADVGKCMVLALVVHLELHKGLCSILLVALLLHIPGQIGDAEPQHWTRHSAHNYYSVHYVISHWAEF